MKTYLYLGTAAAGIMIAGNVYAQCVTTQDCTALGYTETSCPNGKGVKCPFGNKWFCGESSCDYVCEDLGFKYTCSGENIAGGNDVACGGKYKSCNCVSPYQWSSGSCSCPDEYKYSCSASGQITGGEGSACNGKYKSCKCSTGYGWKDGSCVQMVCTGQWMTYFVEGRIVSCSQTQPYRATGTCQIGCTGQIEIRTITDNSCEDIQNQCRSQRRQCRTCTQWSLP